MPTPPPSRRHPDIAIATGCVLACLVMGLLDHPAWFLSVPHAAALGFRRKAPVRFAILVTLISATHLVLAGGLPLPGDLFVLLAVMTVAAHAPGTWKHGGLLLGSALVAVVITRSPTPAADMRPATLLPALLVLAGVVVAWALGLRERHQADLLHETVRQRCLAEHEAESCAQIAADAAREHIRGDVHGVLAHSLASMVVQAESGRATALDPGARDLFMTIAETDRTALREVREELAAEQANAQTSGPGLDDLTSLIAGLTRAGLDTRLAQAGAPRKLGPTMSTAVYRVIQECLANVQRHGPVKSARVRLTWQSSKLTVEVANPLSRATSSSGFVEHHGLLGIRRRSSLHQGLAAITATDMFRVVTGWPLPGERRVAG